MPVYRIKYARNAHQKEFSDDLTSKLLHLSSGFGGGKSFGLAMKAFDLSRRNYGIHGGCVCPSLPDFKKDLMLIIEEILETNRIRYRYHKTETWYQFPWTPARLFVASAEKKLRGPNWGWAIINELGLISHERYKETIGRVRVKNTPYPQIASSGTPEGTAHWLYEVFVENPTDRTRIIYGDTRANAHNLAPDYIATLEASYDPIMLDAYLRGLFVNMKGNRFYYGYDPAKNDDATIEQIPGAEVFVTLDYNVSPMIATLWNVVRLTNPNGVPLLLPNGQPVRQARAFDEIVIEDGADTEKMTRAFRNYGLEPESTTIYPDPAGRARNTAAQDARSNNDVLRLNGWHRIKVKSVAPQFRKRQLATNNMLAKGLVRLNPKTAKALKKDLMSVEQDGATMEKVKSNPKLTHASDGMDYMIDIEFPYYGNKPESGVMKYR